MQNVLIKYSDLVPPTQQINKVDWLSFPINKAASLDNSKSTIDKTLIT